jgi:hypothetical protein
MKAQFDQTLLSSFYLWFENRLLQDKSQAYITNRSNSFKYVDFIDLPTSLVGYQGQFRQLVAENNISVPNSGFFVGSSFITGNKATNGGVYTDYENGRLVFPAASGKNLTITANSTVKEVNTYIANDDDIQTIIHSDFIENGQSTPYFFNKTNLLDEKTFFLPACFISLASSENESFSFGGEDDTKTRIRVLVLTSDNYVMDSVLSLFRDTAKEFVSHVDYADFPYGYLSSVKQYPYSYNNLIAAQSINSQNKSLIKKVSTSKVVSESLREKLNKNFSIAFIDFDLSSYRFPRL